MLLVFDVFAAAHLGADVGTWGDRGPLSLRSLLLPPLKAGGQTGMIEPTFDNSFGPCPQWLWDR